ncbi:sigma-70 family RNA polymerase sigma factor [Hymenobacter sp. BT186]|uniref:Sigma-70 family RNA polymerase sigma factor n=1 Tax=Hymenobacter telluris TaxID=2816474 RepID=A0A939JF23_9BACT|nr:sigma-70 family RNA polymerase sigma factor [Hymenobacter telluris]MBO0360553.1 sigma-70 family RNA polymerase sigma factor [Hymenobacter telluris]MBW3376580.1 sigma-70 family RNA polymerase sigma factor [Hymenobacter norwichensis]
MYTPAPSYNEQRYNEDLALWQAFRAGQQQALATLFDRYAQQLYSYGHHIIGDEEVVKDGIQTVFVNLWARRENLALEVSVKFYLYGSLRRELLKSRKETRMWVHGPAHHENEPSIEQQLVASEDEHQRIIKLSASLGLLSGREKEIINLKYFNNFKIREIAGLLQLNEQTVSNLLYRALQKLRRSFTISLALLLLLPGV